LGMDYLSKIQGDFEAGYLGNAKMTDAYDAVESELKQNMKQKAKDFVSGKELTRLLNKEVLEDMQAKLEERKDHDPGDVKTMDLTNLAVGMYNLDSVYQTFHLNEDIREEDTRMCSMTGISPATENFYGQAFSGLIAQVKGMLGGKAGKIDSDSPGFQCCVKWAAQNESMLLSNLASGNLSGISSEFSSRQEMAKKILECCDLSPGFCMSVGSEKTECVSKSIASGSSVEEGLKTCQVECGKKGYGLLKHDVDYVYKASEIGELVKTCEEERTNWAPSPTVLTPEELTPVLPENMSGAV